MVNQHGCVTVQDHMFFFILTAAGPKCVSAEQEDCNCFKTLLVVAVYLTGVSRLQDTGWQKGSNAYELKIIFYH